MFVILVTVSVPFEGEDNSNEQSSAGNKDDVVPDVRILPSKPNQPKIKFPLRNFGKQRSGFSVDWYENYTWLHYLDNEDGLAWSGEADSNFM